VPWNFVHAFPVEAETFDIGAEGRAPKHPPNPEYAEGDRERREHGTDAARGGVHDQRRTDDRRHRERESVHVREEDGEQRQRQPDGAQPRRMTENEQRESDGHCKKADGAHEIQKTPVRERAPDETEPEQPPKRALLHAVKHDGEADRHEGEHDDGHALGRGDDRKDQGEKEPHHVHRHVRRIEEVERELLAKVPGRVAIAAQDGRLRRMERNIGDGRKGPGGKWIDDHVAGERDPGQSEQLVHLPLPPRACEPIREPFRHRRGVLSVFRGPRERVRAVRGPVSFAIVPAE
jgi:hypothetical protein